jgi:hypothetical protein
MQDNTMVRRRIVRSLRAQSAICGVKYSNGIYIENKFGRGGHRDYIYDMRIVKINAKTFNCLQITLRAHNISSFLLGNEDENHPVPPLL